MAAHQILIKAERKNSNDSWLSEAKFFAACPLYRGIHYDDSGLGRHTICGWSVYAFEGSIPQLKIHHRHHKQYGVCPCCDEVACTWLPASANAHSALIWHTGFQARWISRCEVLIGDALPGEIASIIALYITYE